MTWRTPGGYVSGWSVPRTPYARNRIPTARPTATWAMAWLHRYTARKPAAISMMAAAFPACAAAMSSAPPAAMPASWMTVPAGTEKRAHSRGSGGLGLSAVIWG